MVKNKVNSINAMQILYNRFQRHIHFKSYLEALLPGQVYLKEFMTEEIASNSGLKLSKLISL